MDGKEAVKYPEKTMTPITELTSNQNNQLIVLGNVIDRIPKSVNTAIQRIEEVKTKKMQDNKYGEINKLIDDLKGNLSLISEFFEDKDSVENLVVTGDRLIGEISEKIQTVNINFYALMKNNFEVIKNYYLTFLPRKNIIAPSSTTKPSELSEKSYNPFFENLNHTHTFFSENIPSTQTSELAKQHAGNVSGKTGAEASQISAYKTDQKLGNITSTEGNAKAEQKQDFTMGQNLQKKQ